MANAIKSTGSNKTGGVTVLTELERFVEVGTISKKQKEFLSAGSVGLVSKSILSDMKIDLIIGLPDSYSLGSEGARYCRGVTATAMVITAEQWKELCNLEPTDLDNDINRRLSTLKCKHSFIKAAKRSKATSSIHSLAKRIQKL